MTETQDQPLWRVMNAARQLASDGDYVNGEWVPRLGSMTAAEIRAVADWLVPEEHEPRGMQVAADSYSAQRICQHERQALRQRLLTEADRAERSEER